ncbi:hypothetical protein ACI2IX_06845 [Leifsonia aquatica]|uniref:hypothetical protein n=1 Tax=Leifsonia aquatica TaxID=144185 RepID=UPI00384F0389
MDPIELAAKHAEWRAWVEQNLGGDPDTIATATDAAMNDLLAGATIDDAIRSARSVYERPADRVGPAAAPVVGGYPTSDKKHVRGAVTSFRARNEMMGRSYGAVWDLQVTTTDPSGRPGTVIAVELRGTRMHGSVAEGDWIEVDAPPKSGTLLRVRSLRNLTMNSEVVASGPSGRASGLRATLTVLFVLAFLTVVGWVGWLILSGQSPFHA